ncbi:MAG TPA: type II toxin-antitoxin system antitoxin SocA domain-containing protein [Puia sp.]|nr:type II toxin-antitoxin system antitoxin SocA domain-containing protein [Puia sp.]
MKSPFTGGDVKLKKEPRVLEYRKDSFDVLYHYYECLDSSEQFTTTEIDTLNINQVHNKYREKYGIPFTDEIQHIREKYGLSATKMSEVLGLGINVYRNYEGGEMPSVATGRLIRLAEDADEFRKLLEMSKNALEPAEYERVRKKVDSVKHGWGKVEELTYKLLFGEKYPNIYTGYRVPNLKRIGSMIQFFAQRNTPFTTALNKLMFYADFCHFKEFGHSISGISYKALPKGPVPENYGGIYNYAVNNGFTKVEEKAFKDFVGDQFFTDESIVETELPFIDTELRVLQKVSERFKGKNTKQIVDISHEEPAWKDNVDAYNRISFEYGFGLKNIE